MLMLSEEKFPYTSIGCIEEEVHDAHSKGNDDCNRGLVYEFVSADKEVVKESLQNQHSRHFHGWHYLSAVGMLLLGGALLFSSLSPPIYFLSPQEGIVWSSESPPFSIKDPRDIGFLSLDRPIDSQPGRILRQLKGPLPTNSWCENLFIGKSNRAPSSSVFQVPYIADTSSKDIPGLRVHASHVQANDRAVMMTFEEENSLSLGAVEDFDKEHLIKNYAPATRLAIVLSWYLDDQKYKNAKKYEAMRTHIVRGSPYITMEYFRASPMLIARRALASGIDIIADSTSDHPQVLECGSTKGGQVNDGILVQEDLELVFDQSDTTWILFVSKPTRFICNNVPASLPLENLPPGVLPPNPEQYQAYFELKATSLPTAGVNRLHCGSPGEGVERNFYKKILRRHASVFPTGNADFSFTFPSRQAAKESMDVQFNWASTTFQEWHQRLRNDLLTTIRSASSDLELLGNESMVERALENGATIADPDVLPSDGLPNFAIPERDVELLMFALPHHQQSSLLSARTVELGQACLVTGSLWTLSEMLHPISFHARHSIRPEMMESIQNALRKDLLFELPENYLRGAVSCPVHVKWLVYDKMWQGDTYFSGKMLAKLGRILIIAEEVGFSDKQKAHPDDHELFRRAVERLEIATQVWLNGTSDAPMVFDSAWGGVFGCGCDYHPLPTSRGNASWCENVFPHCPATVDAGQNFGTGYYNDHHFHYGYHIYAAAVLAKFSPSWVRRYHEQVLVLIRDIANPSARDPFFPTFRHKDWYLGSSWASGIVTLQGDPYPNGRNQESSAEAISAYEAVSLYGLAASKVFNRSSHPYDLAQYEAMQHVFEMGRLLLGTEIKSAKSYYHVRSPGTKGVHRIYPEVYAPKVVGMLWSLLAQEQTWFGNEEWKSYGIQLLPLTVASESRDDVGWVHEMLPEFERVCLADETCTQEGYSIAMLALRAVLGDFKTAWRKVEALPDAVFSSAGGNGHSRSNTLWYIATRA